MFGEPVKVLVTGGEGQIARALSAQDEPYFEVVSLSRAELDVTDPDSIRQQLDQHMPAFVINCADYNRIDEAIHSPQKAQAVNTAGVENIALACGDLSIPVVHISTDFVFDGHYASGYVEDDEVAPLSVYGESKWQGEEALRRLLPQHLILRVSWVFGAEGDNYLQRALKQARQQTEISAVDDRRGCPTSAGDVARVLFAAMKQLDNGSDCWGTYHYCGAEITSRYSFCEAIVAAASQYEDLAVKEIKAIAGKDLRTEAQRPVSSVLTCKKLLHSFGIRQRPWRSELTAVIKEIYADRV